MERVLGSALYFGIADDPWLRYDLHAICPGHAFDLVPRLPHFEVVRRGNLLVLPQTIDEGLPELTVPVRHVIVTQSSVGALDIGVTAGAVVVVLDGLRVQVRLFRLLKELFVSQVG